MSQEPTPMPIVAYALSLAAGLLIVAGSVLMLGFGFPYNGTMMGGYYPMMSTAYHMMPWVGRWFYAASLGIIAGAAVLVGALMLYFRPASSLAWGTAIVIFSVLGLLGMGGFFLGSVLGIVGGIIAIASRPPNASAKV